MLCSKCQNIHFQPLEDWDCFKRQPDRFAVQTWFFNRETCLVYFHHDNVDALRASADQGCHFCAMLLGNINRDIPMPPHFRHDEVILSRMYAENEKGLEQTIYILCNGWRWCATGVKVASHEYNSKCCSCASQLFGPVAIARAFQVDLLLYRCYLRNAKGLDGV